jgi:hypothetical protein
LEPFQLCIAVGPLALYLLTLGVINARRRPTVLAGWRELVAIALGLSGFIVIGPMRLFMPEHAAVYFGGVIWLLLIAFYALCFTLSMLMSRPRLVVYNVRGEQLRPVLLSVARRYDPGAIWLGSSLSIPSLGVDMHLDDYAAMRNVALVATGESQNPAGWRLLERELRTALKQARSTPNPRAVSLLFAGGLLLATIVYQVGSDAKAIAQGLSEMLRF